MSKKRRSAAAVLAPPPEVAPAAEPAAAAADLIVTRDEEAGAAALDAATARAEDDAADAAGAAAADVAAVPKAVVDGPRRLATALARLARRVWPALDAAERAAGAAAVDAFVAAPSPASFVAAARTLVRARQARQTEALQEVWGERAFARGAARLAGLDFLDDALVATLTAQPRDAASGRRLTTLAALLEAHAELAARLRVNDASFAAMRAADRRSSG